METGVRHEIRSYEVEQIKRRLAAYFGFDISAKAVEVLRLNRGAKDIVLVDGEPVAYYYEGDNAPLLHTANEHAPIRGIVGINQGAVDAISFGYAYDEKQEGEPRLYSSGIVMNDPSISEGDFVLIAAVDDDVEEFDEVEDIKLVGIGRAQVDGERFLRTGEVPVRVFHHAVGEPEIERVNAEFEREFGISLEGDTWERLEFHNTRYDLVLVDGKPAYFYHEGDAYPLLRVLEANDNVSGVVLGNEDAREEMLTQGEVSPSKVVEAEEPISRESRVVLTDTKSEEFIGVGKIQADAALVNSSEPRVSTAVDTAHFKDDPLTKVVDLFYY